MKLDFTKCKTTEDVQRVFDKNKEGLKLARHFIQRSFNEILKKKGKSLKKSEYEAKSRIDGNGQTTET